MLGTIFIEGKAIGRTNAPILTDGTIYILGIGTEANGVIDDDTGIGDLNGVEFGAKERFVPATIEMGPGLFDFTGTAPNRPISVFGYYGDDRDPSTSGTITISTETDQTLYREVTRAQFKLVLVHSLELSISEKPMLTMVLVLSTQSVGAAEVHSGSSSWSRYTVRIWSLWCCRAYSAQTPENVVTLTLSGDAQETLLITNEYFGTVYASGEHIQPEQDLMLHLVLSSPSRVVQNPSHLLSPPSQFLSALVANLQTDQFRSLDTTETTEIQHIWNNFDCWGTYPSKHRLYSTVEGTGLFNFTGESTSVYRITAIIIGGTATLSGSADVSFTSGAGEQTQLFRIVGDGETALNSVYGYYGDDKDPGTSGQATISGIGDTRKIQVFGYYGDDRDPGTSGKLQLSSTTLVHPFVDYTPSPDGSGLFKITGGLGIRRLFPPVQATGSLFGIGSGDDAYARSTYVGIGNITIETFTPTIIERVQFEEGRTFVVII